MTIAVRLQAILDSKGWTARQLARVAGLRSESHIGHLLKGADPRLSTVLAIAEAADVTVGWLAAGEGSQEPGRRDSRALATSIAREARLDERAIALVLAQPAEPGRNVLSWLDEIRLTALAIQAVPAKRKLRPGEAA